jgi:ADP-ribose pyrophosphatase YjhB (NUDIX family)
MSSLDLPSVEVSPKWFRVGRTQTPVCRVRTMREVSTRDEIRQQLSDAIAAALAELEQVDGPEERYQGASWLVDRLAEGVTAAGRLRARATVALRDEENLSLAQLGERLGLSKARAADIVRDITRTSQTPPTQLPRPVVAVIVTSPVGVLAVRRADKKPLWTFPSGEVEPGETPSDAGVRETKEETGLEAIAGRILGRRVHPQTGRQMIYLAARPAKNADTNSIFVGDEAELDEVRWLSRAEVNELMPGVYEPVLAYLDRDHRRHLA